MSHIMLDLETLDTRPSAVVLSIAACNIERPLDSFSVNLDRDSQIWDYQRTVSSATVAWWKARNLKAWNAATAAPLLPATALEFFTTWLVSQHPIRTVWANGSDFDFPILASLFAATGHPIPWPYYQQRDFRTIKRQFATAFDPKIAAKHVALLDCQDQAAQLMSLVAREYVRLA